MKKIVALLLAAMMLFALVACDPTTDESSSPAGTSNTSSTASATLQTRKTMLKVHGRTSFSVTAAESSTATTGPRSPLRQ